MCAAERKRRCRVLDSTDLSPTLEQDHRFAAAPYIHAFNEPKYHALIFRATEVAKHLNDTPAYVLWMVAQDTPQNPKEISRNPVIMEKKRARWLQYHDQATAGLPGLCPLWVGMRGRVSEKISKKLRILKHCPCHVYGWDLHPADRDEGGGIERVLRYLPLCLYLKFEGATTRHQLDY